MNWDKAEKLATWAAIVILTGVVMVSFFNVVFP
jgi:hypothetical protein